MVWESLTACSPPSAWYSVSAIRGKSICYLRIAPNQHILRSAFLNSIDSQKLWTLFLLVERQWFPSCNNICYCSYCFCWSNDTDFKTEITVVPRDFKAAITSVTVWNHCRSTNKSNVHNFRESMLFRRALTWSYTYMNSQGQKPISHSMLVQHYAESAYAHPA